MRFLIDYPSLMMIGGLKMQIHLTMRRIPIEGHNSGRGGVIFLYILFILISCVLCISERVLRFLLALLGHAGVYARNTTHK